MTNRSTGRSIAYVLSLALLISLAIAAQAWVAVVFGGVLLMAALVGLRSPDKRLSDKANGLFGYILLACLGVAMIVFFGHSLLVILVAASLIPIALAWQLWGDKGAGSRKP